MQLCRALYSDAVVRYRRMQSVDKLIESKPELIEPFCEDEEQHANAWAELDHYNKTHTFLFIHPITSGHQETNRLEVLLTTDPAAFLKESTNANENIKRYNSQIRNNKYKDEEQKNDWIRIIAKESAKLQIMQILIERK